MPFRYGNACLTRVPILMVRVRVEGVRGRTAVGYAADCLPPLWFDKDAAKGYRRDLQDQVDALERGDFQKFLSLVNASGNSSFKWLQNIYTTKNVQEQGVSLALALTEKYIANLGEGACRIHGGGFAGTIQVFLPNTSVSEYIRLVESVFGEGKVVVLSIRPYGTLYLNQFME